MIEIVNTENFEALLPLIRKYQEFYQAADISDARNHSFFSRFNTDNPFGRQFLFRTTDGIAAGFATVYFSFSSTLAAKVGVMNDLYTLPDYRGQGIGKALIEHCLEFAKQQDAVRLQWTTATDNQTAQRLYNSLNTAHKPWLIYTYHGEIPA